VKVRDACHTCLKGLAEKTILLSGGGDSLRQDCFGLIDESWSDGETPPGISNGLLRLIKERTGVYDPYVAAKENEFREAKRAVAQLGPRLPFTLRGVLTLAALGNSSDFFVTDGYGEDRFHFEADMDIINDAIYIRDRDVLILGDNIGDFLFDVPMIKFLKGMGKSVYYAVKEDPVQNDLSMIDVERFAFKSVFGGIISTGTDEVGIKPEDMKGKVREIWESNATVIAKGMGNYETLSEYRRKDAPETGQSGAPSKGHSGRRSCRPVIHIMKVKCPAVADDVHKEVGTYVATVCESVSTNQSEVTKTWP
jgi:damage-control phosphatase, subfamily I